MKIFILLFLSLNLFAVEVETIVKVNVDKGFLEGTLTTSEKLEENKTVALIIAGSGPTNRDGNNPSMRNYSLKMLSDALVKKGISTLRYDKRGIAKSQNVQIDESKLLFDHYVSDVISWIKFLKEDKRFEKIVIIGHSEGSLLGILAAQKEKVYKYISLAGASKSTDELLLEQLASQPKFVFDKSKEIMSELKKGKLVQDVPNYLFDLYRPSIQPYLISIFKYVPREEIKKLDDTPTLIIQGTTDIQITLEDAKTLHKAKSDSKLVVIEGMNHIFKEAPMNKEENIKTYYDSKLPIKEELIEAIVEFI